MGHPPRCTGRIAFGFNGCLDLAGIDLKVSRSSVDEDRQRILQQDGIDRCYKRVGRHNHFIARPDVHRIQ